MPRSSRSRLQLSDEEKRNRRREQKKLSMRRARAKMDAAALEEKRRKDRERYKKKKEDGLIKTIRDFTPREQRQIRKTWRQKAQVKRDKEKMNRRTRELMANNTPPSSPDSCHSRISAGKAVSARNRLQLRMKNVYLTRRLAYLEKKLAQYRMRVSRLELMKKKQPIADTTIKIKDKIREFLVEDENSRLTAGKKETITRRKVKKQIRFLNDSLLNLHKTFIKKTGIKVSYETFRRCRPFRVLFSKAASKDTCLCALHTNNNFIVQALYQAKILPYSSATEVARSLCCNQTLNVSCLERKCRECSDKRVNIKEYIGSDTIVYQRWITKNFTVVIKNTEKICKKTIKEKVKTTRHCLVKLFNLNLAKFLQHIANINNQYKAIRFVKENLSPDVGLLHIDFSENYGCKYGSEIQSAHFGGSKLQLSLHTCVYYHSDSEPPLNLVKTKSICTVSENLRHDPVLICTHLKPVLEEIKILTPNLKELHVLSDGPSTQYRNKTMFHLLVNYISKVSNAERIMWHFSESGHDKGAPDGVGGCIKRTCDRAIAHGRDISNMASFIDCLKLNCAGVQIIAIDDAHVSEIQSLTVHLRSFKGTLQIHQLSWSANIPNILHARRLSCTICAAHINCQHYGIGRINIQLVSNDLESQTLLPSPPIPLSPESFQAIPSTVASTPSTAVQSVPGSPPCRLLSPMSCQSFPSPNSASTPGTAKPDASTVTGPRTPPTPDPIINIRQSLAPIKRLNFDNVSIDSDNSTSFSTPKKCKTRLTNFINSDESDENIFD